MSAELTFSRLALPGVLSAAAVLIAGASTLPMTPLGPVSDKMVQHIFVMNIAAPVVGVALFRFDITLGRRGLLLGASAVQLALIWVWHAPGLHKVPADPLAFHLLFLAALGMASIGFWAAVTVAMQRAPWRAIAALLLTGKLTCLLGALLVFAQRDLYAIPELAFAICSSGPSSVADQQLAGLLMITACPLSYLVAGVAIAARMLDEIARESRSPRATAATP